MDIPMQSPSFCEEFFHAYSLKKSCFFVLIFVIILVVAIGTLTLMVIFVLKPQKPIFSLQKLDLDSYMLDVHSNSTLFVSSVVSLSLTAQNPNKVGIKYSRARLHILNEDIIIGQIRVPEFYQPAQSTNVSVPTRVLLHCVNISQILSGVSAHNLAKMKISGDVKAHVQLFHITLPKVKVALECDINIDDRSLAFSNALQNRKTVETQHRFRPSLKHSPATALLVYTSRLEVRSCFCSIYGEDEQLKYLKVISAYIMIMRNGTPRTFRNS